MKIIRVKGCLTALLFVLALSPMLLTEPQVARAALQPSEPPDNIFDQLMPRSPLVARLQLLFTELKIYRGVIDGRMNDDVSEAVRHYQKRSGLIVDGRVSEGLLAHVEFKSEAEALLVRLDTLGISQRKKARQQLQSAALTSALLNPERKNEVADPARNRDICFQAPTIECLVHEAIESAKGVGRPHFRDWTYGEIAVVQARLGQVDAAMDTAGRVQDPRLILVTLRNIAVSLADVNRLELALDSATIIPDSWLRAEALVSVAVAQTRNGRWPEARQTMQEIETLTASPSADSNTGFRRTALNVDLAKKLMRAGDPTIALRLMTAERHWLTARPDVASSASLSTLAAGFADIDRTEEARSLIDDNVEIVHRRSVSVALARSYGRAGKGRSATAIANALEEPRYRAVLLADLASYQARADQASEARTNLERAETAVLAIAEDHRFAINHARERIVASWLVLGSADRAAQAATKITDAGIRTRAWWKISRAHGDRGEEQLAATSVRHARSSLAEVKNSLDRVWLFCSRVQILADRGDDQEALAAFAEALEVTRNIQHSWTRAQALVRLVRAFSVLAGPSGSSRFEPPVKN